MKYRGQIFFSVLLVGLLVAAYLPMRVDNVEKEAVLMRAMLTGFEQLHYQPKSLNDDFSAQVFDFYLDQIDAGRRFLTQEDIAKLEMYKSQIDDQANAGSFEFFNLSVELLEASLDKTQGIYRELLQSPFNYDEGEEIELDGDKKAFAKNDEELKEYWRQYLQYEAVERLSNKLKAQEEKGEEAPERTFEELEEEVRGEVLEFFDDWYGRMRKLKREDRLSVYLNTFTHIYDPHSEYYKPIDKENFDIRFSGRLEGIGASLRTEGDYTKVVRVVVGGPAWKQKELEENDVIMKVRQEKEEEPVDITGMVIDDVVQLIRGDKGTAVTLTVKKIDGSVQEITITRDVVVLEEQYAKSLILDGEVEGERIGYILLPSFYADFQNRDGRFCAKDVETEIEKLNAQGVDGIILDLRYNGGGSLRDVVKMSGLFIEKGPIVQVKSRGTAPEVLKDVDSRVQYDGPLVVMVNSYSASASEILAAALQDYNRAVIVGSPSTFGKGTVQRFVDLDRTVRGYSELKPLGEIKLTTQKFYRVNGGSTQLKGVTPDIILPDNFYYIKTGERDREYAMEWTEIEPVAYDQEVYKVDNVEALRAKSEARMAASPVFQKILANAKRVETQREDTSYPLGLKDYQEMVAERQEQSDSFDDLLDEDVLTGIENLPQDVAGIEADESKKARNDEWLENVAKDIYLKETLAIMHDMLSASR
ncbi:tail-specific protease [Phaeodactylibacter luteus]|uniref:Tail-specific protease n=2 Tax=Phaeodactylibacter luteus TaxID=1564516 RepID=A0A5C6RVI2_9BACT|nr:tail-specific protease [Phaeodactylibacter luteus]